MSERITIDELVMRLNSKVYVHRETDPSDVERLLQAITSVWNGEFRLFIGPGRLNESPVTLLVLARPGEEGGEEGYVIAIMVTKRAAVVVSESDDHDPAQLRLWDESP